MMEVVMRPIEKEKKTQMHDEFKRRKRSNIPDDGGRSKRNMLFVVKPF